MKLVTLAGVVIGVMGAVLAMAPFAGAQAESDHGQVINLY